MPHGSPSAAKDVHKAMIARLIQITEDCVRQHVASEASVMASVAQRVDPKLKITTSIEYASTYFTVSCGSPSALGSAREVRRTSDWRARSELFVLAGYWKALASTAAFRGKTVLACLQVLHNDIIRVWNFSDPHCVCDIYLSFGFVLTWFWEIVFGQQGVQGAGGIVCR